MSLLFYCLIQLKVLSIKLVLWFKLNVFTDETSDRNSIIYFARRTEGETIDPLVVRIRKKPQWVIDEVIYLKAVNPVLGGRKIADLFNRKFEAKKGMTVSKSYVYDKIKQNQYQIQVLRRVMKHKRPKALPKNVCWGMDLTTVTDEQGNQHQILAVVDYGSRRCLCLQVTKNKRSITLLKCLTEAVIHYGKPKSVKTDNEAVFTSVVFECGLKLLGIKHQKSDIACPWQNGRVERFMGTFKTHIKQLCVTSFQQLTVALPEFQFYYNTVRPHQYLDGKTPDEVWHGIDVFRQRPKRIYRYEAWDGLLTGEYLVH